MNEIESIISEALNGFIAEDYPASFNKEHFYSLKSYRQRIEYCKQNLPLIASGSGRMVFKIDDKTVLKLAKNEKGKAQNEQEAQIGYNDSYFESIVTKVFHYDMNDEWIESEFAMKLKPSRFKQLTGVDVDEAGRYLRNEFEENNGKKAIYHIDPARLAQLHENEFLSTVRELMLNFNLSAGDLGRISSYGEVIRGGQSSVVVTDYGLSDEIYYQYYERPKRNFYR